MMNRGNSKTSETSVSESLPSIGCYVKDEYAEEYHIAPSSERYMPQTSKKNSFGRFGFGLIVFLIIAVGLFLALGAIFRMIFLLWRLFRIMANGFSPLFNFL